MALTHALPGRFIALITKKDFLVQHKVHQKYFLLRNITIQLNFVMSKWSELGKDRKSVV